MWDLKLLATLLSLASPYLLWEKVWILFQPEWGSSLTFPTFGKMFKTPFALYYSWTWWNAHHRNGGGVGGLGNISSINKGPKLGAGIIQNTKVFLASPHSLASPYLLSTLTVQEYKTKIWKVRKNTLKIQKYLWLNPTLVGRSISVIQSWLALSSFTLSNTHTRSQSWWQDGDDDEDEDEDNFGPHPWQWLHDDNPWSSPTQDIKDGWGWGWGWLWSITSSGR